MVMLARAMAGSSGMTLNESDTPRPRISMGVYLRRIRDIEA
jgi:hypothetical protein